MQFIVSQTHHQHSSYHLRLPVFQPYDVCADYGAWTLLFVDSRPKSGHGKICQLSPTDWKPRSGKALRCKELLNLLLMLGRVA